MAVLAGTIIISSHWIIIIHLKESDREDSSAGVASTLKLPSTDSQSHQQLVAAEAAEGCRGPGDCLPCARHVLRPSEGAARVAYLAHLSACFLLP